ncbi:MAG: FAD-dependent oxidoreductase [Lysobacteraceae bacterium]
MMVGAGRRITIAGAGLAGALLGTLLARQGWSVELLERRPDPRRRGYEGGRSINLALASRGLAGLRLAGLESAVMEQAVMMRGRMVHFDDGRTQLQRYGRDDSEVIWSVHRGRLNIVMLDAAEAAGARVRFNARIDGVDFQRRSLEIVDDHARSRSCEPFDLLVGADGAGSAVRRAMDAVQPLGERIEPLGHDYKELEIPPGGDGSFLLEANALHIWPRGGYMCIALPNTEASFTVTLFLPSRPPEGEAPPAQGPVASFQTLPTVADARALFERDFPDLLPLLPDFDRDYVDNPVSGLSTLYLDRWTHAGCAVLVGDAAHAMVPFHGQGMNCAFEDCVALARRLSDGAEVPAALAAYEADRRPNAEAIQRMALENYIEMRDRVDDADFLLMRALERVLADRHPGVFVPRYAMVSFTLVPYATALARGAIQSDMLKALTRGVERLEDVDLDAADRLVAERLVPLDAA